MIIQHRTRGDTWREIRDAMAVHALRLGLLRLPAPDDADPDHPSGYAWGSNGRVTWERQRGLSTARCAQIDRWDTLDTL